MLFIFAMKLLSGSYPTHTLMHAHRRHTRTNTKRLSETHTDTNSSCLSRASLRLELLLSRASNAVFAGVVEKDVEVQVDG
jgi:hypothetical protein